METYGYHATSLYREMIFNVLTFVEVVVLEIDFVYTIVYLLSFCVGFLTRTRVCGGGGLGVRDYGVKKGLK